jgi:hypothetical protein
MLGWEKVLWMRIGRLKGRFASYKVGKRLLLLVSERHDWKDRESCGHNLKQFLVRVMGDQRGSWDQMEFGGPYWVLH